MPDTKPTNELDLNTLLKLIPDFNTAESSQVYRFIRSCDSAFLLASITQQQLLLVYALNRITGPGSSDVHARQYLSWESLKAFLIQKFSQTKTLAHLNLELQSLFQKPSESVTEYFLRVDLCRNKIIEKLTTEISGTTLEGRKITTEETALNVFINGLASDIGTMLRTKEFSKLDDAGRFAIQEDKIRKMNLARNSLYRHPIPAPRSQHTLLHRTPNFNRNHPNTHEASGSRPMQVQSQQRFNVPPTKVCNYCKKPGHLIADCRKRAYNNSVRQQNPTSTATYTQQQPNAKVNHLNSPPVMEVGSRMATTASAHYSNSEIPISETTQDTNTDDLQLGW